MLYVKAEFFVSFFCPWLTACSLLMSCSWFLKMTTLSVKGGAPAGLLDQKKGKFSWFSHSTETHGNVPLCPVCKCVLVHTELGGRVLFWMACNAVVTCVYTCVYVFVCMSVF